MDDAIPEEMKTVKQRRKSQLRNEVHYDSAGDDPELPEPIVLESDSQFAVTETQLADMPYAQGRNNFDGDIDEVGDLDPETAAVLAKFAVAKRDVPKETSNVEFKLLTRHPDSQGPTVQDSAFAFTAAKPGMAKQPGTTSTGSSQPTRGSFEAAMVTGNMPSQGSQVEMTPSATLPARLAVPPVERLASSSRENGQSVKHPDSFDIDHEAQITKRASTASQSQDMPKSTTSQATFASALADKLHHVKAQKKNKKPRRQHRGAQWPPLASSSAEERLAHPAPDMNGKHLHIVLPKAAVQRDCSKERQIVVAKVVPSDAGETQEHIGTSASRLSRLAETNDIAPSMMQGQSHSQPAHEAHNTKHDESFGVRTIMQKSPMPVQDATNVIQHARLGRGSVEATQVLAHACTKAQLLCDMPVPSTELQPSQTLAANSTARGTSRQVEEGRQRQDDTLHHVLDNETNVRVSKTLRKRQSQSHARTNARPGEAPQASNHSPSRVGQALAALSVAYTQEENEKVSSHAAEVEHLRKVNDLLEQQKCMQTVTLNEWKQRHNELQEIVNQLRDRSKTNQKYLAGLQSDYEKLQRSAAICQAECKKVLQTKIDEVEADRHHLVKDFDETVDAISNSQKKMRRFAEELFIQLVRSEAKCKGLSEKLDQMSATHGEQSTIQQCVDELFASTMQSITDQVNNHTMTIGSKLDAVVQALQKNDDAEAMRKEVAESLDLVRQLHGKPFLTAKDVGKAENMLRFMNESISIKLNTFVHTLETRTAPSDDVGEQLRVQVDDLFNTLHHRENLAAENIEYKRSNDSLSRKLEVEQQRAKQLDEQIVGLEAAVQGLETRQSQHETERAQWQDPRKEAELQESLDDARRARLELEMIVKEKMELDQKLQTQQCALQEVTSRLSEAVGLNERLQSQDKLTVAKDHTIAELEQQVHDRDRKVVDMQSSYDQLQKEYRDTLSAKDQAIQDAQAREQYRREKDCKELDAAREQILALREAKEELQRALAQARIATTNLTVTQNTLRTERDALLEQYTDARTRNEETNARLTDIQVEHAGTRQSLENHADGLQQRLSDSEAALKDAEARIRLQAAEQKKKLEFDRNEYERLLNESKSQEQNIAQDAKQQLRDTSNLKTSSNEDASIRTGRKRVNRDNSSELLVQNMSKDTSSSVDNSRRPSQPLDEELSQSRTLFDDFDFEDDDVHVVDPAAEPVEDIQEQDIRILVPPASDRLVHVSPRDSSRRQKKDASGSSSLSEANSDLIKQISNEAHRGSISPLAGRTQQARNLNSLTEHDKKAQHQSDDSAAWDTRSSQSNGRPRSQANMASRMMQPPTVPVKHRVQGQLLDPRIRDVRPRRFQDEGESTPDFMHDTSGGLKQTYTHRDLRHHHQNVSADTTRLGSARPRHDKRKVGPVPERDTPPKRHQTTRATVNGTRFVRSSSLEMISSSQTNSASSAFTQAATSRSVRTPVPQETPRTTTPRAPPARKGRSTALESFGASQPISSSGRRTRSKAILEDRFSQELDRR